MAAALPVFALRTLVTFGLVASSVKHCSGQTYRSESAEVGRLVQEYDSRFYQQPAHELGFGYYYQGDIMLPAPRSQNRLSLSEEQTSSRWPNAIVPYLISSKSFKPHEIRTIQEAMNVFHTRTCVRFMPRTPQSQHYVRITSNNAGCYASVGRQLDNGQNVMNLQTPACLTRGTPIHELMHVLGFLHEVSRPDRDEYVYVNRSALKPEYQTNAFYNTNFAKFERNVETYHIPYNYGSIMHYTRYAGARDRRYPILMNKKPYSEPDFGHHTLSQSDIDAVNSRYCRNAISQSIASQRPFYPVSNPLPTFSSFI
ncbi:hatching enzyme 1.2-like [Anopheles ziemanni]|uniref:hatching enzyme 1.2-like n=1 Tax=Anopheles coustani TaxID=139045 RepID=UPI0026583A6E|nr:hatching enzyme 1.2-like [Anopheles coustani]XP_058177668.1 hatching enzyme 1.2-like [Anopheles ziemanni]